MTVGTLRTPYLRVIWGASSMSSLPTLTLPACSSASFSTMGARALQGPHQVAVKSTRTGTSDLSTSASKFLSSKCKTFGDPIVDISLGGRRGVPVQADGAFVKGSPTVTPGS